MGALRFVIHVPDELGLVQAIDNGVQPSGNMDYESSISEKSEPTSEGSEISGLPFLTYMQQEEEERMDGFSGMNVSGDCNLALNAPSCRCGSRLESIESAPDYEEFNKATDLAQSPCSRPFSNSNMACISR